MQNQRTYSKSVKIDNVGKNISYFDVYNISEVVNSKAEFASKIASLAPNSSLVINCKQFDFNEKTYNTGDIVLKNNNEQVVHIHSQSGGLYYPLKISKVENLDGTYEIQFQYTPNGPIVLQSKTEINDEASFAGNMIFTGFESTGSSNIYGLEQPWDPGEGKSSASFTFTKVENVKPYIKFFIGDNETGYEELVIDYELTENKSENSYNVSVNYCDPIVMRVK